MADPDPESQRPTIQRPTPGGMPSAEQLSERFDQLEVLELIGRGGMGYVYKARQPNLDRLVALKLLPVETADDPNFAERFAREARALAKLNHPNIVTVHDSGRISGQYYFVMEFVDGVNLRQAIHGADGRLGPDEARRIVTAVCDALDYAHDEGVVHRDIKPENILLDARGRVKIADFGLAKLLTSDGQSSHGLTLTQQTMGTPHYMAPEQTERPLEVDHRADIYSVGVVFYEMITGELPLGRFPLPSEMGHGNAAVDDIVARALQKDPNRRFQRVSEVGTAIESALGGTAPGVPTGEPAAAAAPSPATETGQRSTLTKHESAIASAITEIVPIAIRLRTPARFLKLIGIVTLCVAWIGAFISGIGLLGSLDVAHMVTLIGWAIGCVTSWLMIVGSGHMKRLESRRMALLGCVAALIPFNACMIVLTLPVGIWCLAVMSRRDAVEAFRIAASERAIAAASAGGSTKIPIA